MSQLEMKNCPRIKDEDNSLLMAPFDPKMCWHVLKLVQVIRPLGLVDTLWSSLNCVGKSLERICRSSSSFHEKGFFEESLNATFVALILKKVGAVELNDIIPISLFVGGWGYKIIVKLLQKD